MKTLPIITLCCYLGCAAPVAAYAALRDDNPFVEAMLRMMEMFGLIDRSRFSSGAPYLPGYGQALGGMTSLYGLGGLGGLGGFSGLGAVPGLGGMPAYGMPGVGGLSGLGSMPGAALAPGLGMPQASLPGLGGWPMAGLQGPGGLAASGMQPWQQWPGSASRQSASLDGIWELSNGGVVIIRGDRARFYLSRERYQDFVIAYDREHLSWAPLRGGSASRYRYQARDGRMVLQDKSGHHLLLRRRR